MSKFSSAEIMLQVRMLCVHTFTMLARALCFGILASVLRYRYFYRSYYEAKFMSEKSCFCTNVFSHFRGLSQLNLKCQKRLVDFKKIINER